VFSTHDPDHAFLCADRVAMVHDGGLPRVGPPSEAITPESLKLLYGVDVRMVEIPGDAAGGPRRTCVPALRARV
jgi:iron complex transport system ATP-binding protein